MRSQIKKSGFNFIEGICGRLLRRTFLLGLFIAVAFTSCGSLTSDTSSSETNEQKSGGKASITVSCNIESRTFRPTDVTEDEITKVELWASGDGLISAGNGASGGENGSTGGTNGSSGAINGSTGAGNESSGTENGSSVGGTGSSAPNSVLLGEWISSDTKNALTLMKEADSILMDAGTYTFTLNLYVSHDSVYALCQTGILSKTIKRGKNNLSFSTEYLTDGRGTLRAQISWPEDANFERMDACLYKVDENLVTVGSALYTTEVYRNNSSTDEKTALYNVETVSSGDYKLVLRLYDAAGNKINTYSYGVTIATECVTNSIINLSGVNCDYAVSLVIHRYAQWANGDMSSFGKPAETFTLPTDDDISMEGYLLTGWNTKQDGTGDAYKPGDTFTIPGTSTLYARWAKSYKVKFVNGTEEKTVKVVAGTTVTEPDEPERSGYTFLGWAKENIAFNFNTQIFDDITLISCFLKKNENNNSEYLIENIEDWNSFAAIVSGGKDTFKNKTIKMTTNIGTSATPVKTMVGITTTNCFCGTFDGDGHTLTVDYDSLEQYCAPFKYTGAGVNIKNLKIEGKIKSSKQYTAGLIGYAYNASTIINCSVSAEISSTYSGAAYNGGFISYTTSSTYSLENCVFNGKMLGASATYNGGFVGNSTGTTKLTNCLFAPSEVTMGTGSSSTFSRNSISTASTNYFYTTSLGAVQGVKVYKTLQESENIVKPTNLADGNNYFVECTVTLQDEYNWTGTTISLSFSIKIFSQALVKDTDYAVTINTTDGTIVSSVVDSGDYVITFTGKGNSHGTVSKIFSVIKDLDGNGSQSSPYLITSIADWNKFSKNVASGTTYSGKYVKLTSDIGSANVPVTTMIGTSSNNCFTGTFDGDNHTITVAYNSSEQYCAPFSYAGTGVNIKNLKIAGKINSSKTFASGLIGHGINAITISNCVVSAEINSTYIGNAYNGGFIGWTSGSSYSIKNSVFNGKMLGSTSTYNAGFVASGNGTTELTNCLFAPSEVTMGISNSNTFVRNSIKSSSTDYFYTISFGNAQGARAYKTLREANGIIKSSSVKLADGNDYYAEALLTLQDKYKWTGNTITPSYSIKLFSYTLVKDTDYTVTIKKSDGSVVNSVIAEDTYTITFTGKGNYQGTVVKNISVKKDLSGNGTETSPYLISSLADWNKFASEVSSGNTYSGKYLKLTADIGSSIIPITTMIGTSTSNSFRGTFDGDNHTIAVDYDYTKDFCAPFKYASGATIKNLKVKGTIKSSANYTAGLVGYASTISIFNCTVSAEITSSSSQSSVNCGGFIGYTNSSTTTFENCVFNGKLDMLKTSAGFVGGSIGSTKFTNCLFNPKSIHTSGSCNTFAKNKISSNSSNFFYTKAYGSMQGIQAYTSKPSDIISKQITLADEKKYYIACEVFFQQECSLNGTEYIPSHEITFLSDSLIKDRDYTVRITKSDETLVDEVREAGDYIITFTGIRDFTGAISKTFTVIKGLEGEGTEENPYIINSIEDWNTFGKNVADGATYSEKIIKLTSNIGSKEVPVTTMIGTSGTNCFKGTFNGDSHTITVNYNSSQNYCAPFNFTGDGVTIKNLTVSGKITSSKQYTAGMIGYAYRGASINNCVVSTEITSTYNGSAYNGGFIGETTNNYTYSFENCVFTGKLLGSTASYNGGYVGSVNGSIKITNCLFAPSALTMKATNSYTFAINLESSDYYYTTSLGSAQGYRVVKNLSEVEGFYKTITFLDETYYTCEKDTIVTSSEVCKCVELSTSTDFELQFCGKKLINGTDYSVQILDSNDNSVEKATKLGNYTCIFTGKGDYSGTATKKYEYIRNLLGKGTESEPFLINDVIDWDVFSKSIGDGGITYHGKYVKLNADIGSVEEPVTTQIGTSETNCFCGNFDGDGHIVTINYISSADYCAPFKYVGDGVDIRNLNVSGNVTSSGSYASGLIGYADNGRVSVSNCKISAELNFTNTNNGGFIGQTDNNSYVMFENCIFDGNIIGQIYFNSGFIGLCTGTTKLMNCLYIPASEAEIYCSFVKGAITSDSTNYFYTVDSIYNQGGKIYSDINGIDGIFAKISTAIGNEYFAKCRVSVLNGNVLCYSESSDAISYVKNSLVDLPTTNISTTVSDEFDVLINDNISMTNGKKCKVTITPKSNSLFYGAATKDLYLYTVIRDTFDGFLLASTTPEGTKRSIYVCPHEVTQAEYETYCSYKRTPTIEFGLGKDYPAYYVSWHDAIIYCNLRSIAENLTPCYSINNETKPQKWPGVSAKQGKLYCTLTSTNINWEDNISCNFEANGYRLPTRTEWEYAARGGTNTSGANYDYSAIQGESLLDYGWFRENSSGFNHPVEQLSSNSLGLYDMNGNVFEWCWDNCSNASGSSNKGFHGILGGSWKYEASLYKITRGNNWPAYQIFDDLGFRVVRTVTE